MTTALMILKRREDYSADPAYSYSYQIATGMWNSASFVVETLNSSGISAELDMVIDANYIDALVVDANPAIVVIEGLWVTPEKFAELLALPRHAGRTWMVRIHSEIPFLATEGAAMDWIKRYADMGVLVAPNAPRAHDQIRRYLAGGSPLPNDQTIAITPYLPNTYPVQDFRPLISAELDTSDDWIDVACFGAYRPLKNHLQQATTLMDFANSVSKNIRFHVNDRQDAGGNGPFRNVSDFFANLPSNAFELVLHGWEDRETFLTSLSNCDLLLQTSFSETFNIVAADAVLVGRPVVASDEIPWIYPVTANPTDHKQMVKTMELIWSNKAFFINQNRARLRSYNKKAERLWVDFMRPFDA